MYVNKCIKCGREFETKNPKRVICPDCLYPDKKMMVDGPDGDNNGIANVEHENCSTESSPQFYSSYSAGSDDRPRPPRQYNNQGGYRDLITTDIIIKAADTTVSKEVKDLIITVREDITDLITTIVLMAISNKEDLKITDLITEDLITEIKHLNRYW